MCHSIILLCSSVAFCCTCCAAHICNTSRSVQHLQSCPNDAADSDATRATAFVDAQLSEIKSASTPTLVPGLDDKYSQAVLKFNEKPKHGIEYMTENSMPEATDAAKLAEFFNRLAGLAPAFPNTNQDQPHRDWLDKTRLGDFLGEPAEFNKR